MINLFQRCFIENVESVKNIYKISYFRDFSNKNLFECCLIGAKNE